VSNSFVCALGQKDSSVTKKAKTGKRKPHYNIAQEPNAPNVWYLNVSTTIQNGKAQYREFAIDTLCDDTELLPADVAGLARNGTTNVNGANTNTYNLKLTIDGLKMKVRASTDQQTRILGLNVYNRFTHRDYADGKMEWRKIPTETNDY